MTRSRFDRVTGLGIAIAVVAPPLLTLVLTRLQPSEARAYVFLYLGIVVSLGMLTGLIPALVAAALSSVLTDYFFVPPVDNLSFANPSDIVYLVIFFATAGAIGGVASQRRRSNLAARALSRTLAEANVELERLYREQAAAARTAVRLAQTQQQVAALRDADRIRRELLQNVSHELRTPLASILTGSTVLLARTDLSGTVRDGLTGIVAQSRRLDRLVGDMLDLARIEGHALDLRLEPTDAGAAAEAAAERLRRLHPERQVDVTVNGGPVEAVADWDRLGQVLDNLLGNARAHTAPGTPVSVALRRVDGTAEIVVADRGPGLTPEQASLVFERFYRADASRTRASGGVGLGLSIVAAVARAHGGQVSARSTPGDGATFVIELPLQDS